MNNKDISLKYGESLRLITTITSDLTDLSTLVFYVGKGGDELPAITSNATITPTEATIYKQDVTIPLGEYFYQYTATYLDGSIDKFPKTDSCNPKLPKFIVTDAIDSIEVS